MWRPLLSASPSDGCHDLGGFRNSILRPCRRTSTGHSVPFFSCPLSTHLCSRHGPNRYINNSSFQSRKTADVVCKSVSQVFALPFVNIFGQKTAPGLVGRILGRSRLCPSNNIAPQQPVANQHAIVISLYVVLRFGNAACRRAASASQPRRRRRHASSLVAPIGDKGNPMIGRRRRWRWRCGAH